MDTHKQMKPEELQSLKDTIEADDATALANYFTGSNPAVGLTQTPYALVYDAERDAGYILEGEGDSGFLVFDVVFLDNGYSAPGIDANNAPSISRRISHGSPLNSPGKKKRPNAKALSPAASPNSTRNKGIKHGLCTCAHFAALVGAKKCLAWILGQEGGRQNLAMAHHSGQSLEELSTDGQVLEVLYGVQPQMGEGEKEEDDTGMGAPGGRKALPRVLRAMSDVALDREHRTVNSLRNKLRAQQQKSRDLLDVVNNLHKKADALRTEVQRAEAAQEEKEKQLFRAGAQADRRLEDHRGTLDSLAEVLLAQGNGDAAVSMFQHLLRDRFSKQFPKSNETPEAKEPWVPQTASQADGPKALERTPHYKLVGLRSTSSTESRRGRIQPINFNTSTGQVEGANGVAFRAINRHGQQIVLRGLLPSQPHQYTHGSHPNLLSVMCRFKGASALLQPWAEGIPAQVDYAVVEFFPSVLASSPLTQRRLGSADVASILIQVSLGLSHLRAACGAAHNDVHERHVFLAGRGFLKLGGFNLSAPYQQPDATKTSTTFVTSDVFKLGQMVLRLAGDKPAKRFAAREDFSQRPHTVDNVPKLPFSCHPALRELVSSMLDWDAAKRPSLDAIIASAERVLFDEDDSAADLLQLQKAWLLADSLGGSSDAGDNSSNDVSLAHPHVMRYLRGGYLDRKAGGNAQ